LQAEDAEQAQSELEWCRRVIDVMEWNWGCPSRACRRNGCQNPRRCEPDLRLALSRFYAALANAQLRENSADESVRNAPEANRRRAVLAHAKRLGILPFRELGEDEADPKTSGAHRDRAAH
jgi:hypothetical protein